MPSRSSFHTKFLRCFLFIIVIAFFFGGCAAKTAEEEQQIKKAIARYNYGLTIAYKELSVEPIKDVAGKERTQKVDTFISAYLNSGLVMEAELHDIEFKEIKVDDAKAGAKTQEKWSYTWLDYKSRKPTMPKQDVSYMMLYSLSKKDGRWIVADAKDLSEKKTINNK